MAATLGMVVKELITFIVYNFIFILYFEVF